MARMKILWLIVVFLLVAICEGGSRIPPIYEPSENNDDYYIYAGNDTSSDNVTVTDAPEIPDVNITTLYTTDAPPTENVTTDVNITTFYTTDAPPPENVTTDINITTLYPTDAPPTENVTTDVNITTLYTTDAPPPENVTTDINITTLYTTDAPPPENVTTDVNITTLYTTDAPPPENVTTDINITTLYTTDAPPPENVTTDVNITTLYTTEAPPPENVTTDINITTLFTTDAPPPENVTTDVNITTLYTTEASPPENVTTDINITTLFTTDAPPPENVTTDVNITTLYTTDAPPPENVTTDINITTLYTTDAPPPENVTTDVNITTLYTTDTPPPANVTNDSNITLTTIAPPFEEAPPIQIGDLGYLSGFVIYDRLSSPINAYLRVPYAKPPVDELRFKDPEPATTLGERNDPRIDMPYCVQYSDDTIIGQEDCLYLNIYVPVSTANDSTDKPVMVFLHGNTFDQGSGRLDQFDPRFLLTKDVILVTVNFRLGIFGFFHLEDEELGTPGNAALKDQRLALAWVKEHIHNFGGDENNICIFGQSAGAASVHFHMLSPRSEGLFHKAIIQSGTALSPWVLGTENNGNKLADKLEEAPENNEELLSILRGKEAYEILAAARTIADELRAFESPWSQFTGPIIESHGNEEVAFLADAPINIIESGEYNAVPMLLGFTNAEGVGIETMLRRVNDGWEGLIKDFFNLIPSELGLKRDSSAAIDLARRIEEFYFDGDQPEEGNVEALVRLFGDIFFAFPALRTALEHYRTSDEPIYLYKFSLDTDLNVFGWRDEATANIAGASHGDDLGYLFYIQNLTPSSLGPVEIAALENVVETWTRFARTGSPSIQIEEQPEEPEDQPEEPENQPEEPEDQPEVPENQPEGPEDQPVVPEAPPPQPDGPPEAPGTQGDGQVQPNVKENQLTQLDQPDDADDSESIGQWLPFTEEHPYFADIQQNGTIPSINPSEESMAFWEEVYNEFFRDNGGTASLQSISIVMVLCVVATQILLKYY